jgi:hypothetical protein
MAIKIRTDFVTNSSSTSFCIVGRLMTPAEDKKYTYNDYNTAGLDCHGTNDADDCRVAGLDISKMNGDETFHQFKKRVVATLNRLNEKNVYDIMKRKIREETDEKIEDITIHYGGYRDG